MTDDTKHCPRCGGEWLWSFTFQHRLSCPLLAEEDVTKVADSTKLRARSGFARHATAAELELAAVWEPAAALALDGSTQTSAETTVRGTPAVVFRVVVFEATGITYTVDPRRDPPVTTGDAPEPFGPPRHTDWNDQYGF
ncbi:hypothetical protein FB554_1355 [Barrientosiimonas humi]|uniref:Uncharacterized protein n=1 Tax=Barrientosiimonas humi TaxID=999931 RepID=A0A542XBK2_9MICO|nr:hypothetical protein [Barrientosiimonas humi]TQL33217.1 hypothetical protein FB554_1355 [Barrientosiimonas humi]CAG7573206.1 hypothetical protein BH39T_PBIAJDOK_01833 [Barrientosiimonas humi]